MILKYYPLVARTGFFAGNYLALFAQGSQEEDAISECRKEFGRCLSGLGIDGIELPKIPSEPPIPGTSEGTKASDTIRTFINRTSRSIGETYDAKSSSLFEFVAIAWMTTLLGAIGHPSTITRLEDLAAKTGLASQKTRDFLNVVANSEADPKMAEMVGNFLIWVQSEVSKPSDPTISILFLSADPTDASRLRLGEEFRAIQENLRRAQHVRLELPQLSIRPPDISQALLDMQPRIVHFSGHGTAAGELCFENQIGETHLIQPDALAALFEQFANQVDCVVLNACYSEIQANAIAQHIDYVIGMNQAIGDKAAIAFAIGFYQAVGAGRTIEEAYKFGCVQIRLQGIPDHLTPVLVKKGATRP